jgi:DNA-binding MarR family transcriptional regulator
LFSLPATIMSNSTNHTNPPAPELQPTDPEMNVGYLLGAVRSRLMQQLDADLSEFGMTAAQFVILRRIADGTAGTAAELCRSLQYDTGSMTRMLDRLEEKSLISRERSPDDRRVVHIRLTQLGNELFPKLRTAAIRNLNQRLAVFNPEELAQFTAYLQRMLR